MSVGPAVAWTRPAAEESSNYAPLASSSAQQKQRTLHAILMIVLDTADLQVARALLEDLS